MALEILDAFRESLCSSPLIHKIVAVSIERTKLSAAHPSTLVYYRVQSEQIFLSKDINLSKGI